MKTALAAILLTLSSLAAPDSRAQSSPPAQSTATPQLSFSITNSQLTLRSLDGGALPLQLSEQRQHLLVRSYGDNEGEHLDSYPDPGKPVSVEASYGDGFSRIEIAHIFGDVSATVAADTTKDASFNDIVWGSGATFTLPARSFLTMVAWVSIDSEAAWDSNYAAFERGLIAGTEGATGERFILDGSRATSQYFLTALNPLDEAATFYYYSNLYANAYSVTPVPEPAGSAMLAAGLAAGLALRTASRTRQHGRRT
ncbi:hypothetical protein [Massilia sp. ST3]|uniref:hypothetical protein n=1 Tax=Massilia sp. ST3 TaxID=2824903 RepID=UPI001B83E902|nr:hypothetical protein [Massilia sp. ST3]MBQ5946727.1 hypothetical protein [Massilia sp. ST3]